MTDNNIPKIDLFSGGAIIGIEDINDMKPSNVSNFLDDENDYMKPSKIVTFDSETEHNEKRLKEQLKNTPTFGDDIYKRLPPIFETWLKHCKNEREKDVTIISILCHAGAYFSRNTSIFYNDDELYTTLNACVFAPSSSGKRKLKVGDKVFQFENDRREERYKIANEEYTNRQKDKDNNEFEYAPIDVPFSLISVDSDSRNIQLLAENGKYGEGSMFFFEEMDEVTKKMGGQHSETFTSMLRKVFDHSKLQASTKGENRTYRVRLPKLGFCGSGTLDQINPFFGGRNSVNGLLQRFNVYVFDVDVAFSPRLGRGKRSNDISTADRHIIHTNEAIQAMGKYEVLFDTDDRHNKTIKAWGDSFINEWGSDKRDAVYRTTCQMVRLIAVLERLNEVNNDKQGTVYISDESVKLAMDISSVLLEHTLTVHNLFVNKVDSEISDKKLKKQEAVKLKAWNEFKAYIKGKHFTPTTFALWEYESLGRAIEDKKEHKRFIEASKKRYLRFKNLAGASITPIADAPQGTYKFTHPIY